MNGRDEVWGGLDGIVVEEAPLEVEAPWVEVVFRSRRAFLRALEVGAAECRLSCPREGAAVERGPVRLRLRFQAEAASYELPAEALGADGVLYGARVRISGPGLATLAAAVAFAKGNPPAWGRRGAERVPTDLSARLRAGRRAWSARLQDLSRGGARLSAPGVVLAPGEVVELGVRAHLLSRAWLRCRVSWTDRASAALGLEFVELTPAAQRWLIRSLREGGGAH